MQVKEIFLRRTDATDADVSLFVGQMSNTERGRDVSSSVLYGYCMNTVNFTFKESPENNNLTNTVLTVLTYQVSVFNMLMVSRFSLLWSYPALSLII